jgi:hypothetical protein
MYEAAVVTVCAAETREVILGSRAIATSYRTAPSTDVQLKSSGCVGNEIEAPFAGDNRLGAEDQTFLKEWVIQRETEPFL